MKPPLKTGAEVQLSSAIQQYQFWAGQLVQSLGFLVAADAVLLGYGINGRTSGAILLAALIPLAMLVVRLEFGRQGLVAAYVAIELERRLDTDADSLISMQVATRYPRAYRALLEILRIENQDERVKALRKGMKPRNVMRDSDTIVFIVTALAQVALFLFALIGLNRPFI
jgi:hypothetical protein